MRTFVIALSVLLLAAAAANDAYVLSDVKSLTTVGEEIDLALVSKLPAQYGEHFFWMRRGGKTWVVRDAATLERARELLKPQRDLNVRRAEISHRQILLTRDITDQSRLNAQLGYELSKAQTRGDDAKVAELQPKLMEVVAKLGDLRKKQAALDDDLAGVIKDQRILQPEMMKTLDAFAEEAIAKGVAKAE